MAKPSWFYKTNFYMLILVLKNHVLLLLSMITDILRKIFRSHVFTKYFYFKSFLSLLIILNTSLLIRIIIFLLAPNFEW